MQEDTDNTRLSELLQMFFQKYQTCEEELPGMKPRISRAGKLVIDMPGIYPIIVDQYSGAIQSDHGKHMDKVYLIHALNSVNFQEVNRKANNPAFLSKLFGANEISQIKVWKEGYTVYAQATLKEGTLVSAKPGRKIMTTTKDHIYTNGDILNAVKAASYIKGLSEAGRALVNAQASVIYASLKGKVQHMLMTVGTSYDVLRELFNKNELAQIDQMNFRSFSEIPGKLHGTFAPESNAMIVTKNNLIFYLDLNTNTLTLDEQCEKGLNPLYTKIDLIVKHFERYVEFKDTILQTLTGTEYTAIDFRMKIKQESVAFLCSVSLHHASANVEVQVKAFKTEMKAALSTIKQTVRENAKKDAVVRKEAEKEVRTSEYYGNCLVISILHLIQANEVHITETTLTHILRGTKVQSDFKYNYGDDHGLYNMIKKEEISALVKSLTKTELIRLRYVNGEYTDYYELKLGNKDKIAILTDARPSNYPRNKRYADYTDVDWVEFLAHTDPASLNDSAWMKILPILDHVGLYCKHKDMVVKFFRQAPESIKTYVKEYSSLAEGSKKKLLVDLRKELAESA